MNGMVHMKYHSDIDEEGNHIHTSDLMLKTKDKHMRYSYLHNLHMFHNFMNNFNIFLND